MKDTIEKFVAEKVLYSIEPNLKDNKDVLLSKRQCLEAMEIYASQKNKPVGIDWDAEVQNIFNSNYSREKEKEKIIKLFTEKSPSDHIPDGKIEDDCLAVGFAEKVFNAAQEQVKVGTQYDAHTDKFHPVFDFKYPSFDDYKQSPEFKNNFDKSL